jgi:hypothetical protein
MSFIHLVDAAMPLNGAIVGEIAGMKPAVAAAKAPPRLRGEY